MTTQVIQPSNDSLQCIGLAFPETRCTWLPEVAEGQLPVLKRSTDANLSALAYRDQHLEGAQYMIKRQVILFYAPKVYPLRYRDTDVNTFWLNNCRFCDKRAGNLCLANPKKFNSGSCIKGIYPKDRSLVIQSPWPTLAVHISLDRLDSPYLRIYTPVEHTEDLEYMVFKTLYTGHSDTAGSICLGDALNRRDLFSRTGDARLYHYSVANYLTSWLSAEFKPHELEIPSNIPLKQWLENLATEQAAINVKNYHEGSFLDDLHVFKIGTDRLVHSVDGSPLTSILTTHKGSNYVVSADNQTQLIQG